MSKRRTPITQLKKVQGAVIVSTPQDVALIDARKGVGMFNKVSIPVCPSNGQAHYERSSIAA